MSNFTLLHHTRTDSGTNSGTNSACNSPHCITSAPPCHPHASQSDVLPGSKAPRAGGEMAQYGHWHDSSRPWSVSVSGAERLSHNTKNGTPAYSSPPIKIKGARVAVEVFGERGVLHPIYFSVCSAPTAVPFVQQASFVLQKPGSARHHQRPQATRRASRLTRRAYIIFA